MALLPTTNIRVQSYWRSWTLHKICRLTEESGGLSSKIRWQIPLFKKKGRTKNIVYPLWFILYNTSLKSSMICTQKLYGHEATKFNTKHWSEVFVLNAMKSLLLQIKMKMKWTNKQKPHKFPQLQNLKRTDSKIVCVNILQKKDFVQILKLIPRTSVYMTFITNNIHYVSTINLSCWVSHELL